LNAFIDETWERSILGVLHEYLRIPNKSPFFDPQWAEHGHMERAVQLVEGWCRSRDIAGMQVEVVRLPGRTPLLFVEVAGAACGTVLLYGHLDKQPELSGWMDGTAPFQPTQLGDRLYGRGGADDGYAVFAALTAIEAVQRDGGKHARCVLVIECCEESGSPDLPAYMEHLSARIGQVDLVICLDSGCGDYARLWTTTSLRGMLVGNLTVQVLREGVHSGDASGIVPSSFRIARALLSRLEDERTGKLRVRDLYVAIPKHRVAEARATAKVLGKGVVGGFPWAGRTQPMLRDTTQLVLNRTWRPTLSIVGAAGMPAPDDAGSVLRTHTTLTLSIRLPPTCDAERARKAVTRLLTSKPPHGAKVTFEAEKGSSGWNAPPLAPWLAKSLSAASKASFGKDTCAMGEGGSIPFMGMLGKRFPRAQFVITGVLGPQSNAHGPNEFLHIPTAKRLTACIARVLADHASQAR
jgi:acetylornithine deacetylase/succinyl-diaminopimelate desuccinylase-like protein